MTTGTFKDLYFNFFKDRGHVLIPSASLVPKEDPAVLFTTAGMHPLVPYLLGQKHPAGKRLVDVQKCLRTGDIESVGDATHLTFFEMLGNWSLGDYWKKESIEWSWEFLTSKDYLAIEPQRIYITVFEGDTEIPQDYESLEIWREIFQKHGIDARAGERITLLGREDNFWGPIGGTGPCGPDTEIFYDTKKEPCGPFCAPGCVCGKYFELWNNVFMEYNRTLDGKYIELSQKNVDTGMGVERTAAVLSGKDSVFETEVFLPLMETLGGDDEPRRIIADHIRASCFILAEDVLPSNKEHGYILRRLIRRALVLGIKNKIDLETYIELVQSIAQVYRKNYPEIIKNAEKIKEEIIKEQKRFGRTIADGLKKLENLTAKNKEISGENAFELFSTYGFPIELTSSLANEKGVNVDMESFREEFKKHQEISRKGLDRSFKGGLYDHGEMSIKYHTASHLLIAALRKLFGEKIVQKGSNITPERLRLDFNFERRLTQEELKKVEELVNGAIAQDIPVSWEEMNIEEAFKGGALGVFGEKYGNRVKVYSIGNFSKEICGGPHVEKTGALGKFKIIKEEGVNAGVRRIRAILE